MRILFTGASSFTGYWFVRELVAAGHEVVAACRGDGRCESLRAERMKMVRELCETRFGCAFGNDEFLALAETPFDVLCDHGAEVGDYRSPDFDPYRAAAANLYRLPQVLRALQQRGCGRLVLTGTFFESNGAGSKPLRAFDAYGLSKGLTATAAEFYSFTPGARVSPSRNS
jgi:nucleoside-diphosphate-sugar epimerase